MMGTQTEMARCGACGGIMVLIQTAEGYWFVCGECPEETTPRPTMAEADADVVWTTVTPARKERK